MGPVAQANIKGYRSYVPYNPRRDLNSAHGLRGRTLVIRKNRNEHELCSLDLKLVHFRNLSAPSFRTLSSEILLGHFRERTKGHNRKSDLRMILTRGNKHCSLVRASKFMIPTIKEKWSIVPSKLISIMNTYLGPPSCKLKAHAW